MVFLLSLVVNRALVRGHSAVLLTVGKPACIWSSPLSSNKILRARRFRQWTCGDSQPWRLEVQDPRRGPGWLARGGSPGHVDVHLLPESSRGQPSVHVYVLTSPVRGLVLSNQCPPTRPHSNLITCLKSLCSSTITFKGGGVGAWMWGLMQPKTQPYAHL